MPYDPTEQRMSIGTLEETLIDEGVPSSFVYYALLKWLRRGSFDFLSRALDTRTKWSRSHHRKKSRYRCGYADVPWFSTRLLFIIFQSFIKIDFFTYRYKCR
jgi:hypothetical protein